MGCRVPIPGFPRCLAGYRLLQLEKVVFPPSPDTSRETPKIRSACSLNPGMVNIEVPDYGRLALSPGHIAAGLVQYQCRTCWRWCQV